MEWLNFWSLFKMCSLKLSVLLDVILNAMAFIVLKEPGKYAYVRECISESVRG